MEKNRSDSSSLIHQDEEKVLLSPSKDPAESGGTSSMTSAAFNFINSILGSGVIGLPYSMAEAGLPLGLLLLFLVAFITDYTIILLIKGGNLSGTHSYQALVHSTFGFTGYLILSVLQFLYPFVGLQHIPKKVGTEGNLGLVMRKLTMTFLWPFHSAMISYNIVTGDTLTKVFQRIPGVGPDHILAERHFVICVFTVLFTIPLSLHRDMAKLGKVSFVSLLLTLGIIIIVIVRATTLEQQIPPSQGAWVFARWNAIQAVGVMSFAFICHHNSFIIYKSLKKPTLKNWSQITHVSVGSSALISALFAATGYATFTGYSQGDIFENYCKNDNLATFGRFCYGLSIITTFPLECFVTREVVSNVFFKGQLSNAAHIIVSLVIILVVTAISLTYDCLGVVLELSGVVSATPLIFIVPSACYLKLSSGRWFQKTNLIPILIVLAGFSVMIIGLIMTSLFPQDCSHGVEMFYCAGLNSSDPLTTTPHSSVLQTTNTTSNVNIL